MSTGQSCHSHYLCSDYPTTLMLPGEGDLPLDIELDQGQPEYQDIHTRKVSREECMRKLQTCKWEKVQRFFLNKTHF